MVDGIHSRHYSKQHLGGADVTGGTLTPDVLLPGLQGKSVCRGALGIYRDAYEPSWHGALEFVAHCQVASVRTTKAHWDPKALGGAADHVRTLLTRRGDQGKCHEVCCGNCQSAKLVDLCKQVVKVDDSSRGSRVLNDSTKALFV